MSRIVVARKIRWEHLRAQGADLLLFSALVVVGLSYGLGYRLDWTEEAGRPEDESVEAVDVPAPASFAAVVQPPPGAAAPMPPASMGPAPEPAIAPAAPTPQQPVMSDAGQAQFERMTSELGKMASRYPGRVAITLKDLKTGRRWDYHPDDLFPSASLIKVPVLVAAFYKIREGKLSLDEKMTVSRRNRVGGSGSLKWRNDGTKLTVRELLIHMIAESDNTATKMILDRLGMGYVQQQFPRMGLLYTGIYEEGMSIKGGRVMHENYTTAREMTMLLEKIYKGEMVDRESSALMLQILKHPKPRASRLAKGLPQGWEIAHKTGLLRQACHDTAIFLTPDGAYAMTVLTGQNRSYSTAKDFITKLGKVTFKAYNAPQYVAKAPTAKRKTRR
jgi:beta-lactamase class A